MSTRMIDLLGAKVGVHRLVSEDDSAYLQRIHDSIGAAEVTMSGFKLGDYQPEISIASMLAKTQMSLRDYFAAKALQSLVASLGQHSVSGSGGSAMYGSPEIHARSAYAYADAMLAERAKQ